MPNVVCSCGGMIHNDHLIIPYGMSDIATGFASVSLADLLRVPKGWSRLYSTVASGCGFRPNSYRYVTRHLS